MSTIVGAACPACVLAQRPQSAGCKAVTRDRTAPNTGRKPQITLLVLPAGLRACGKKEGGIQDERVKNDLENLVPPNTLLKTVDYC